MKSIYTYVFGALCLGLCTGDLLGMDPLPKKHRDKTLLERGEKTPWKKHVASMPDLTIDQQYLPILNKSGTKNIAFVGTEYYKEQNALFELAYMPIDEFRNIVANATPAELQKFLQYFESNRVAFLQPGDLGSEGYQEKINILQSPPALSTWAFRPRTALMAAVSTLGLLTAYNWFTSKKQTKKETKEYQRDVLINNTGKSIWVAYNDSTEFEEVAADETYELSGSSGTLKIKASEQQLNSSALSVKFDRLAINHLNIIIYNRSKWMSWWFGPLGASEKLVPETTRVNAE